MDLTIAEPVRVGVLRREPRSSSLAGRLTRLWIVVSIVMFAGVAEPSSARGQSAPLTFRCDTMLAPQPPTNVAYKGIAIRLPGGKASVLFDAEMMRMAAGWVGEIGQPRWGDADATAFKGKQVFGNRIGPGFVAGDDLADPRTGPDGPLPAKVAKYKGLYRHGEQVVLSYRVADCDVLELPGVLDGFPDAITRTFHIGPRKESLSLVVCEVKGAKASAGESATSIATLVVGDMSTAAIAAGTPKKSAWVVRDGERLVLALPPSTESSAFRIAIWNGPSDQLESFREAAARPTPLPDVPALCQGGPSRDPAPKTIPGELGKGDGAYLVDTLHLPEPRMFLAGIDFFADGRAAVCTHLGEVWIVSGIDADLANVTWKRFAAGLFHPMGLKIVDDVVYVAGRDQVTRLHDRTGDGEADFYENFNNDFLLTAQFMGFVFDLHTDPQGDFYFASSSPVKRGGSGFDRIHAHHGNIMKLSKDGAKLEVFASGLRQPNGMAVGPKGEITVGDNEGSWVPSTPLHWVRKGDFLGVVDAAHRELKTTPWREDLRAGRKPFLDPNEAPKPLCWIPYHIDNSAGGQIWVTSDRWGPFQGSLLHTSYGVCELFHVLKEEVDGRMQGGVVAFPLRFRSGIHRGRFRPQDGQLYVCGMRGYQTRATFDGALQRVRYTGQPVPMPIAVRTRPKGIELTFAIPLDSGAAGDVDRYAVEWWNYRWSPNYGSPHLGVEGSQIKGQKSGRWVERGGEEVEVESAKCLPDGKTVFLEIPTLRPVMQMSIRYNLKSREGASIAQTVYLTIHNVPKQ